MTALLTAERPPKNPWLPSTATIRAVRPETPGVQTYEIVVDDAEQARRFGFTPGQFNMLFLPGFGEAAISLSSDPARPEVMGHTVRVAGNVTQCLARMKTGDKLGVRGPYGTGWPMEACRGRDVVLAAGGIGLAPLRPAIYHFLRHRSEYGRLILLYGSRTPGDLLYTEEYSSWRDAGLEVETTVDIGDGQWQGNIGVVPVLFYRLRLNAARTSLLTCGPEIMIRFVIFEALARRVKPDHIFVSMERNMQCAVGLCGHCQLGPYFVCKDGPVFSYRDIEAFMHVEDL